MLLAQEKRNSRHQTTKLIWLYRYTKALDSIKTLRKERVADLKAEKEHLEGLRRERGTADKLRKTISDLTSTIASKQIKYD